MVIHSQGFSPKLSKVIGGYLLRMAVRAAMIRAASYGFSNRGSMRLFIEMTFLFGSTFDTDPQYYWVTRILRDPSPQMQRSERLYVKILDYQQKVSGYEDVNTLVFLNNLSFWAYQPLNLSANDFVSVMRQEMIYAFPQKAAYLGKDALQALIGESCAAAQKARFPSLRGYALMVWLMYAFGHGCVDDPLYPWIGKTLNDERITEPSVRAERLERKALTWLNHVIENSLEGVEM